MLGQNALGAPSCTGGVPLSGVYYNRASSVVPAVEAGLRAGVGGVSIGRFGWAAPDGRVLNARSSVEDVQGLVVTQMGDWRRIFWDDVTQTYKIREGFNLTLLSASPGALIRIENGSSAPWTQRIYTDPVDGRALAAYALGLESTPWSVVNANGPNGLSLITTWNKPQ